MNESYTLDENGLTPIARACLPQDLQLRVEVAWSKGRALMLNANKANYSEAFTIEAEQYVLIREAIYEAIAKYENSKNETLLKEIVAYVQMKLGSHPSFPKGRMTNYTRYTKTDLEARGELVRVAKSSPQRVKKVILDLE